MGNLDAGGGWKLVRAGRRANVRGVLPRRSEARARCSEPEHYTVFVRQPLQMCACRYGAVRARVVRLCGAGGGSVSVCVCVCVGGGGGGGGVWV